MITVMDRVDIYLQCPGRLKGSGFILLLNHKANKLRYYPLN